VIPKAILLDLDDTILDDTGSVQACWEAACHSCAPACRIEPDVLMKAIHKSGSWFWSDAERHRVGRLDLRRARIEVARLALAELGIENRELAEEIGGIYDDRRDEGIEVFPDAIDTLKWFRESGARLALLTNGNGPPQRKKIERFGIERFFDAIFIEGEVGFGKPDERVYRLALDALAVDAQNAWMAGDNLEWDVAQPQRLGIFGIWIDAAGSGHSKLGTVRPDRIVRRLSDLRDQDTS
jgi:putative hydrolase of the HAD superfamily